nr:DUF1846 domain-containing protein [Corynebacterium striatum]
MRAHRVIPGYPSNTDLIVSEEGLAGTSTRKPRVDLVVVTAARGRLRQAGDRPIAGLPRAPARCAGWIRQV